MLRKVVDPDQIKILEVDRSTLPPGQYRKIGFDSRQVFDSEITGIVTEYRTHILEHQVALLISTVSIYSFNQQGFALLEQFEQKLISQLWRAAKNRIIFSFTTLLLMFISSI